MAPTDPVSKLNELIQGIPTAILTTVRPDSSLHSRPMAAQPIDDSGAFWFLTGSNTEKVEAVTNDSASQSRPSWITPRTGTFPSAASASWCVIARRQSLCGSRNTKRGFPAASENPDLVLMKIVVQEAEYWDPSQGRMVELNHFPNELQ